MKSCLIQVTRDFRDDFKAWNTTMDFWPKGIILEEVGLNKNTDCYLYWLHGEGLPDWCKVTLDNAMNRPMAQVNIASHDGILTFQFEPYPPGKLTIVSG